MARQEPVALGDLLAAYALSPVEAQREFDRRYRQDLQALSPAAAVMRRLMALPGMVTLLPRRSRIEEISFSCSVLIRKSKNTAFSIGVENMNLGFRIARGSSEETESRLELWIQQAPAPPSSISLSHKEGDKQVEQAH